MRHPIIVLPDGSVILALPPEELVDPVCADNAKRGIGGYTGRFVGRLVFDDETGSLALDRGVWQPDPDDSRSIPGDQKRPVYRPETR